MIKLKDIKFGKIDGRNEAELQEFEDLFYNNDGIYEKLLEPDIFIISGRKGSGKTTLIEYFIKKNNSKANKVFSRKDSYENFRLNLVMDKQTLRSDIHNLWKWTILIELTKLIVSSSLDSNNNNIKKLTNFLKNNQFEMELGGAKTIEITNFESNDNSLSAEIGGSANFEFGAKIFAKIKGFLNAKASTHSKEINSNSHKLVEGGYLEQIRALEKIIFDVLEIISKEDKNNFFLIYDELDSFFETSDDYKNSIKSLVSVINSLNNDFRKKNINCKIIICLRNDIFRLIENSNTNKLTIDHTLNLNWHIEGELSPLIKLIANKIKASHKEIFVGKDDKEIFYSLFNSNKIKVGQKNIELHKYFLEKTLHRPRDIVYFFMCFGRNYGDKEKLTKSMINSTEAEYSSYFFNEVKSELYGHFNQDDVDNCLNILINFQARSFFTKDLELYIKNNNSKINEKILSEILEKMFIFGVLGLERTGNIANHTRIHWAKNNDNIRFSKNQKLHLHKGLLKYFNLV